MEFWHFDTWGYKSNIKTGKDELCAQAQSLWTLQDANLGMSFLFQGRSERRWKN